MICRWFCDIHSSLILSFACNSLLTPLPLENKKLLNSWNYSSRIRLIMTLVKCRVCFPDGSSYVRSISTCYISFRATNIQGRLIGKGVLAPKELTGNPFWSYLLLTYLCFCRWEHRFAVYEAWFHDPQLSVISYLSSNCLFLREIWLKMMWNWINCLRSSMWFWKMITVCPFRNSMSETGISARIILSPPISLIIYVRLFSLTCMTSVEFLYSTTGTV